MSFDQVFGQLLDFMLLGMESFIGIWVCAAFLACAYPESLQASWSSPAELFLDELSKPLTVTPALLDVSNFTCKQLQAALREKGAKYYGMNKEAMVSELLRLEGTLGM